MKRILLFTCVIFLNLTNELFAQPINLTTTNILDTSAVLNWDASPCGGNVTLHYKVLGTAWPGTSVNPATSPFALTALNLNSTYEWRVKCAGTGTWSSIQSFSTGLTGCTDALACNYDSAATSDDGGCNYATTSTTDITACDSYAWYVNGTTYDSTGIYSFNTLGNYHSYDLDGVNDYIYRSYPSFSDSYGDNPFSFMSWVKLNGSVNSSPIICKDEMYKKEFHLQVSTNGYLRLRIFDELNNSYIQTQTTALVTQFIGEWHNIAFTYDGSSSELGLNIYIDGENVNQNKLMYGNYVTINPSNTPLTIGKRIRGDKYLDANIDGASLWDKELDQQDIINYMQCSPNGNELDLIYYWNFDDGANFALDMSPNNNHGIFSGGNFSTHLYSDYSCVLQSVNGCDSVAILNLTINNSTFSSESITSCDSLVWNGVLYDSSGVYTYSTTNSLGCDSVHTLVATINYSNTGTTSVTACDSYLWNAQSITASGIYNQSFTNVAACDSVHTLIATINYSNSVTTSVTACDSYDWNGFTYTASGTYMWNGINSMYCDSNALLHLTILESNNTIFSINSCDSYIWRGSTYNSSGLYYDTLVNQLGCDSILTLALTIHESVVELTNVNACDSYTWNGTVYTQSGNYTWQGSTMHGCDSILYLNLTVSQNTSSSTSQTVCDSLIWNNLLYTTSGNYNYTSLNSNGCDSTITLNLTVNYGSTTYDTVTICYDQSLVIGNSTYTLSGIFTDTIISANGCISTITTNLTVADELDVYITQPNIDLEVSIFGGIAPYSYLWNTQSISQSITPLTNGNYWVLITDDAPCISDTVFFYVENITTSVDENNNSEISIFPNPTERFVNIVFGEEINSNSIIKVFNSIGKCIYSDQTNKNKKNSYLIDLDKFANGIYQVEITSDTHKVNKKIIITK